MKEVNNDAISNSISFIENKLLDNLSINELVEQAFFSKTHYQRLFHTIVGEPVESFTNIENELDRMSKNLMSNRVNIIRLLDELTSLIQGEIKNEASFHITNAINMLKQTADTGKAIAKEATAIALSKNYDGNGLMRSSLELQKRVEDILSVLDVLERFNNGIKFSEIPEQRLVDDAINRLENVAFFMNLNSFNADIETVQSDGHISVSYAEKIKQYAGQLHQTHASCVKFYKECVKLTDILKNKSIAETYRVHFIKV